MIFPYSDDNSDRKITPFVNFILIACNVFVFIVLQRFGSNELFTYAYSTVPAEILTGKDIITAGSKIIYEVTNQKFDLPPLYKTPVPVYLTTITSMFMHAGISHIFGNLFFLHLFGDNIENRLGHGRYIVFYLLTGIIASLSHVFATYFQGANPYIPCLGASGAISAVMGAYMYLFPQNKVRALLLYFPIQIPAVIALGIWIALQVFSGLGGSGASGGVAYAAHIGGFIAGFMLIKFFIPNQTKA
jgi:membrane associated rhomboid family serine protease